MIKYQISVLGIIPLVWMLLGDRFSGGLNFAEKLFSNLSPLSYLIFLLYCFTVYYFIEPEENISKKRLSVPGYLILAVMSIFFLGLSVIRILYFFDEFNRLANYYVLFTGLFIPMFSLIQTLCLLSVIMEKLDKCNLREFNKDYLKSFLLVSGLFMIGIFFSAFAWHNYGHYLQLIQKFFTSFFYTPWWIILWMLLWLKGGNERSSDLNEPYFERFFCMMIIVIIINPETYHLRFVAGKIFITLIFMIMFSLTCISFFNSKWGREFESNIHLACDQCRQVVFIATLTAGTISVFAGVIPAIYVILYLNFILIPYLEMNFGPFPRIPFNSNLWKESDKTVRRAMAGSLVREYPHNKIKRYNFETILGKPDILGMSTCYYDIGGSFLEKHFLRIRFYNTEVADIKIIDI